MGLKSGSKSGRGVKQGSAKLSTSKISSASKHAQANESDDDTSIMRPSIEISVSGVPQLVKAFQGSTEELKSMLTRECDIIYECRVCRNLFRSLANMISHKRVYCKTLYSYTKHFLNRNHVIEDYTVVIQPEPTPSNSQDKQDWKTSDEVPNILCESDNSRSQILITKPSIASIKNEKKSKKGLKDIVEKLTRSSCRNIPEGIEGNIISEAQLYDHINESVVARKKDSLEHSYHLENIETSEVGKFQTKLVSSSLSTDKEDLMKAQVSELQNMALQSEAVIGPDGHTILSNRHLAVSSQNNPLEKIHENNDSKASKDEHVCPDCNVKFSTRKTLNHHMKSLHVTFRLCYPCPCCKSTFVNPWSVYRHLYKVHRKTAAQVRRLRPQIQKKAFRKEFHTEPVAEANPKNEELKELQRLDQENQTWMDNFEDDLELQRCGGCGRRFERRAALNSHSQICQKRIAARNNVKIARNSPSTSSTEKVNKLPEEQSLFVDLNKKNEISRIMDSVNDNSNSLSLVRARQNAGNAWVDHQKKEVREKKIEIQIRKDYCKMSSSSSVLALSNDTQSEPSSRPPSRIVEDEESFDNERDWDSSVDLDEEDDDDERKEESDSNDLNLSAQHSETLSSENSEKEYGKAVRNFSSAEDSESPVNFQNSYHCGDNTDEINSQQDGNFHENRELSRKRKIVENDDPTESSNKKTCQNFLLKRHNMNKGSLSLSSKYKKLEQFHPVMEARMKELINFKRLQCLPCQKKFIKLTNLRRHVAVHIGWCRYRCVLCPFKCFSKSDCVDHVSKIHLKGSQRNQSEAMVEYIEEQEPEAISETYPDKYTKEDIDQSSHDEATETLSIEVHSLNIEDIKNIVGVISYNDDLDVCKSPKTYELPHGSSSPKVNDKKVIKIDEDDMSQKTNPVEKLMEEKLSDNDVRGNVDFNQAIEKKLSNDTNKFASEVKVDSNYPQEMGSTSLVNVSDISNSSPMKEIENLMEHLLDSATRNLNENIVTQEYNMEEEINLKCVELEQCDQQNEGLNIKTEQIDNWRRDESYVSEAKMCNDNLSIKTDYEPTPYLIYDDERSESFQSPDESDRSDDESSLSRKQSIEINQLHFRNESPPSPSNLETDTSIKLEMKASDTKVVSDEDSCHESLNFSEERPENYESADQEDSNPSNKLAKTEDGEIALRKMVMEVIFGSGVTPNVDVEDNHKLFTASMNGDVNDCESVNSRTSRCSSETDIVSDDNNQLSFSDSDRIKSKLDVDINIPFESERRERPVRNRVKVAKEDFIYDFTESYMKKEEQPKIKKRQTDTNKESTRSDSSTSHSHHQKPVPKLTLVRTDCSETISNSHVSGPIKGTWSSVYSSSSDLVTSKTNVASSSQMYSSRKISRIHDVKP